MTFSKWNHSKSGELAKSLKYLVFVIIAVGILLRLAVFLQCNSMYIDEANIARNIYERTFSGLIHPLSYDQFAPPVFLWVVKLCTTLFGYSEYSYRLYPFVCGILSLWILLLVLRYYTDNTGIWYVLLLFAFGPIYVRYTQATKQYSPDIFITLILLWLALKNTFESTPAIRLFLLWSIVGSIAIWSSMPSAFILAGIGCYYLVGALQKRDYFKVWFLLVVGIIWLIQFAGYYIIILKPQTGLQGLVNYHKEFFFYPPISLNVLLKDINLVLYFISTAGGYLGLPLVFHIICITIGIAYLGRRDIAKLVLLIVPVFAVFFAAALHQYSLIQRVSLFAMPLLLILIAVGLQQILHWRFPIIRLAAIVIAIICVVDFNALRNFVRPLQTEEIKLSLDFLKKRDIKGTGLCMHNFASPAYIYYTQIHPQKEKWTSLLGASTFVGGVNIEELVKSLPKRFAIMYSWEEAPKIEAQQLAFRRNVILVDSNIVMGGKVYIYQK